MVHSHTLLTVVFTQHAGKILSKFHSITQYTLSFTSALFSTLLGYSYARYAFIVNLLSWSMCYSMTRTLANSTETVLLMLSLTLWVSVDSPSGPLSFLTMRGTQGSSTATLDRRNETDRARAFYLAFPQWAYVLPAVSSWCRPTSLCFWTLPMISDVMTKIMAANNNEIRTSKSDFTKLSLRILCAAGMIFNIFSCYYISIADSSNVTQNAYLLTASSFGIGILVCFWIDFCFYGVPTCPPWKFFYVNIVQNVAERYGTTPWHWLFSNAMPTMLGSLKK